MAPLDIGSSPEHLARELENFQDIASYIVPQRGEIPSLGGFDICGEVWPLNGVVGGDHMIFMDFKNSYDLEARIVSALAEGRPDIMANLRACQTKAGFALVDVSGHRVTDALLAAMFHQAFLLGSIYELDMFGGITKRLFENLNTRFYNSSSVHKFLTMLYAEITEDGKFRFLSAAHPVPLVFSNRENRFMDVAAELSATSSPLGTMPSTNVIDRTVSESLLGFKGRYQWNEWQLMGRGDILLLFTDGLSEHGLGEAAYVPSRLEEVVRESKEASARELLETIRGDLLAFAEPSDDISLIVIKST